MARDRPAGRESVRKTWPVTVRQGVNQYGRGIRYLFNYSEDEREAECVWDSVKDLLTGKCFRRGDRIMLKDWAAVILEDAE